MHICKYVQTHIIILHKHVSITRVTETCWTSWWR